MARRIDHEKANRNAKVKEDNLNRREEKLFGKEPKQWSNPSADKPRFQPTLFTQAKIRSIQARRAFEKEKEKQNKKEEKLRKKQKRLIWQGIEGYGAKDLLFTADHLKPKNYGNMLGERWRFDSKGNTFFEKPYQVEEILALKSEYLCLGFPKKIIENLKTEIHSNLKKTPNSISRIEQILIERLCHISIRKTWSVVVDGTIRQVFEISRKGLKNAQKTWPETFQYK